MNVFSKQRSAGLILFLISSVLAVWAHEKYAGVVSRFAYLSGWALFGVMLALTFYNARKKISFLPLLSSEAWLQFHIYAGLLTAVLFLVHISYKMPTGWFEGTLAWLYILVMLSGFFGLFVSRTIPKRLTTRGGEVLFERIPGIRRQLQDRAEALALKSVEEMKSSTIADFYARELKGFFDGTRNVVPHLFEVRTPLNLVLNKITELNRYLNDSERATMDDIATLVRQKDGLDYHYSLQLVLKLWLFVHIPLTYSLLLWTLAHIVLVFAFSGGAR
ncbi:MAG TPA: hypothetical protein VH597_15965 [Verrucomicrobiae bacterium]|jgi:hypothetical protein|nr:hypothetical protein [Verrucomicrobiae bacterium]